MTQLLYQKSSPIGLNYHLCPVPHIHSNHTVNIYYIYTELLPELQPFK